MRVLTTPNPVLIQAANPVAKVDKKILKLVEEMKRVLLSTKTPKGVGLAAPQVGVPLRIFITKPFLKSAIRVFLNPEIVWLSEELTEGVPERDNKPCLPAGRLEGCLSVPGVWGMVKRRKSIELKYMGLNGQYRTQKFQGFLATIIQHEMDHLDGRLFSSRVLEQKSQFYEISQDENGKDQLKELEIK